MNNKRRNFRLTFAAAAVLLAVIAFFLVSILGNLPGARLDLTRDQLFTMSPAAAEVLEGLKVPVQVKLYITPADKMPTQLRTLERDITEQMRNFEQVAERHARILGLQSAGRRGDAEDPRRQGRSGRSRCSPSRRTRWASS